MSAALAPPIRSPLLTTNEVAALCRVTVRTVYRLIDQEQLAAVRVGGRVMIHRRALERLIGPLGDEPAAGTEGLRDVLAAVFL